MSVGDEWNRVTTVLAKFAEYSNVGKRDQPREVERRSDWRD